jgi:hypothetical protein
MGDFKMLIKYFSVTKSLKKNNFTIEPFTSSGPDSVGVLLLMRENLYICAMPINHVVQSLSQIHHEPML